MDIPVIFLSAYIAMQILGLGYYLKSDDSTAATAVATVFVLLALIWAVGSLAIR